MTVPKIIENLDANLCPAGGEHVPVDDFAQDGGRYFLRLCHKCSGLFGEQIPGVPKAPIYDRAGRQLRA